MGTIRESIESAFVAVAFAERNRPDEAVWQLRGEKAAPSLTGRAEASAAATSATQTRTATAGQRQRPVLRAE
ncbi:hypothetical protein RVX_R00200 [Nitratidesulfovibrio sp. HK-II]|uniref:hypothetical protein n=1 Tax=Nitratidesulfovibrio sp. HK-II TaxID=2009266 RepID=UPI00022757E9|nr:hypothetical protein [Nitratidesulfovibrio sp. HK-II]EGY25264.1 hypothetical protein DA2_2420 [Desulfovibrio sp. A2]GBO97409.1 hypothetical protein RVX_2448 [Nitratidesulfovibrio sp. HK-II]